MNDQETSAVAYVEKGIDYDNRNGELIDLGLADSPIGAAPEVLQAIREFDPLNATHYAEDVWLTDTKLLVIEALGLDTTIHAGSLKWNSNGSYGAGDEVFRLLKNAGYKEAIVTNYSFPNVSQWSLRHGVKYLPIISDSLHPIDSQEAILDLSPSQLKGKIVYVDYPNNPTGIADPELVRDIVEYTSQHGAIPFIDLAFAEVLGDEFADIIHFVINHDGVATASLSKTQGLPKLRGGVIIMSHNIADMYDNNERLVYGLTAHTEAAFQTLYQTDTEGNFLARSHAENLRHHNIHTNTELYKQLEALGVEVLPTQPETHVQVIHAPDTPDFYFRLAEQGIKTESLNDYAITLAGKTKGYQNSAVRLLTPNIIHLDEAIRRIKLALR